jgi:hypothetical protein
MRFIGPLLFILLATLIATMPAAFPITLYNKTGDPNLEGKSEEAAARLNEALASLRLMYSAFQTRGRGTPNKDIDSAVRQYRRDANTKLLSSIEQFTAIQKNATENPISLRARNETERGLIDHFRRITLERFGIAEPKNEKELAAVAVIIVSAFQVQLANVDIDPKKRDSHDLKELMRAEINLVEIGLAVSIIWSHSSNSNK